MLLQRASVVITLVLGVLVPVACQVVGGYETFDTARDAGPLPHPCDAIVTPKSDTKNLSPLDLVKSSDGSCFWVDDTEVTVAQYRRFVDERPAGPFTDTNRCGWKTKPSDPERESEHPCTRSTSTEAEPFLLTKPIRCVDWCDAREFCRWAGKDLCASSSQGLGVVEPLGQFDEWGRACSATGDPYPYGVEALDGRCNIGRTDAQCYASGNGQTCAPTPVGTFSACTGQAGAKDIVGNVSEWVFSCVFGDGGPETLCTHRGGSFTDGLGEGACSIGGRWEFRSPRSARQRTVGFRCCASLTPAERATLK